MLWAWGSECGVVSATEDEIMEAVLCRLRLVFPLFVTLVLLVASNDLEKSQFEAAFQGSLAGVMYLRGSPSLTPSSLQGDDWAVGTLCHRGTHSNERTPTEFFMSRSMLPECVLFISK